MTIEYAYPSGDYIQEFFLNNNLNSLDEYSYVDEGTAVGGDGRYIFAQAGNPAIASFLTNNINTVPNDINSIWINLLYSGIGNAYLGGSSGTIGGPLAGSFSFSFYDVSGTFFTCSDNNADGSQAPTYNLNTGSLSSYSLLKLNFGTVSASGNQAHQWFPPLSSPILTLAPVASGSVGRPFHINFEAVELQVSGDNSFLPPFNSCTLFINGPGTPVETGMTLFIAGDTFATSGCDLFIKADNFNNSTDLFLKVIDPTTLTAPSGLNLTVWTHGSSSGYNSNQTTLYLENHASVTSGIPLIINAGNLGTFSSNVPLYINSKGQSGILPLFLSARTAFSGGAGGSDNPNIPLYINGSTNKGSGQSSLFIRNNYHDINSSQIPLYIENKLSMSGGMTLFTLAGFNQKTAPLYLKTLDSNDVNNSLPLYVYSAANSGIYKYTSLFIDAAGINNNIPLYMKTNESAISSSQIPLYIRAGDTFVNSVNLYVESARQSGGMVNLNIVGAGLNPNSYVLRSGIPLYMARANESIGNGTNLFMNGPSGGIGFIPLIISGQHHTTQSLSLSIPVVDSFSSGGTNLYTHGF